MRGRGVARGGAKSGIGKGLSAVWCAGCRPGDAGCGDAGSGLGLATRLTMAMRQMLVVMAKVMMAMVVIFAPSPPAMIRGFAPVMRHRDSPVAMAESGGGCRAGAGLRVPRGRTGIRRGRLRRQGTGLGRCGMDQQSRADQRRCHREGFASRRCGGGYRRGLWGRRVVSRAGIVQQVAVTCGAADAFPPTSPPRVRCHGTVNTWLASVLPGFTSSSI